MKNVNPARAGMIRPRRPPRPSSGCKPRASGDDPNPPPCQNSGRVVNPARAGMIRFRLGRWPGRASKPRASGDDPEFETVWSPLEE